MPEALAWAGPYHKPPFAALQAARIVATDWRSASERCTVAPSLEPAGATVGPRLLQMPTPVPCTAGQSPRGPGPALSIYLSIYLSLSIYPLEKVDNTPWFVGLPPPALSNAQIGRGADAERAQACRLRVVHALRARRTLSLRAHALPPRARAAHACPPPAPPPPQSLQCASDSLAGLSMRLRMP